jgi:hypothetical protein
MARPNHWDVSVLSAGGASGGLKIDGRHINYIPDMPFPRPLVGPRSDVQTGRVFIAMLRAHGFITDTFGQATGGPLPELMPRPAARGAGRFQSQEMRTLTCLPEAFSVAHAWPTISR